MKRAEALRGKPLACGGKGPCCHIGYAHRHCEHCDMVISLHQCAPIHPYYWGNTWWNTTNAIPARTASAGVVPALLGGTNASTAVQHDCQGGAAS